MDDAHDERFRYNDESLRSLTAMLVRQEASNEQQVALNHGAPQPGRDQRGL